MASPTKFEIIRAKLGEATLHGLYAAVPESKTLAIHFHGTWGNFYGNEFPFHTCAAYLKHGISFATVNIHGHDETAIDEKMPQSIASIDRWLDTFPSYTSFILQGHSLGALKIMYYLKVKGTPTKVRAAAFFSPFDIVAFYMGKTSGDRNTSRERLLALNAVDPTQLVPHDLFALWPISVGSMLELATEQGDADLFNCRQGASSLLSYTPPVPFTVFLGQDDFAAYPSAEAVASWLGQKGLANVFLINGAPHNFAGKEDDVRGLLDGWLKTELSR